MLETESPWDTYYLLRYFSPLNQERLFPVGTLGGQHLPGGFPHPAAQGWKQLILLNQQQRQNYTQCQNYIQCQNYTQSQNYTQHRAKTTSPGTPKLLLPLPLAVAMPATLG